MKRTITLVFVFLSLAISGLAQTVEDDWKTISGCNLSLSVPRSVENTNARGKDSCLARFESPAIWIVFDVSRYHGPIKIREAAFNFVQEELEVDGNKAEVATYKVSPADPKAGFIAELYVPAPNRWGISSKSRYSIAMIVGVKEENDLETAKRIFRSVKLLNKD